MKAIEQIKSYRSWTAIDMYLEIREALQAPHEYAPEIRASGDGRPPNQ